MYWLILKWFLFYQEFNWHTRTHLVAVLLCFWGCCGCPCEFQQVPKTPADPLLLWSALQIRSALIMSWLVHLVDLSEEVVLLARFNMTNTASFVSTAPQVIKLRNMPFELLLLPCAAGDWWDDECEEEGEEEKEDGAISLSLYLLLLFFFNKYLE